MRLHEYRAMATGLGEPEPLGLSGDYQIELCIYTCLEGFDENITFTPVTTITMVPEMSIWDVLNALLKWFEPHPFMADFEFEGYSGNLDCACLDIEMRGPGWQPSLEQLAAIDPEGAIDLLDEYGEWIRVADTAAS